MSCVQYFSDTINSFHPSSFILTAESSTCLASMLQETGVSRNKSPNRSLAGRMVRTSGSKQQGMTLLELTVVLLILTTLATIALRSTSGLQDQTRWEQTKNRYEAIRASIIGDPELSIYGQPDISGFVADMGRIPYCLQELLEIHGYCSDTSYCTEELCDDNSETWTPNIGPGGGEIDFGWKGPYLTTSENADETYAFSDGWGQTSVGNYGWLLTFLDSSDVVTTTTSNAVQLKLQSAGRDGVKDTGGETVYDLDYPVANHTIEEDDYTVNIVDGFSISVLPPYSMDNCEFLKSDVDTFVTYESCDAAGGGWTSGNCSIPGYYTADSCGSATGTWTNGSCLLDQNSCEVQHPWVWDSINSICANTINSKSYCESNGGTWNYNEQAVCMKIFYRSSTPAEVIAESSVQFLIIENGQEQINTFTFAITEVPMGINAIGLYEYDSATSACTSTTYPNAAMPTIKLSFIPHQNLPAINW